eukprot:1303338-Rhodomonas_salina.1
MPSCQCCDPAPGRPVTRASDHDGAAVTIASDFPRQELERRQLEAAEPGPQPGTALRLLRSHWPGRDQ